MKQHQERFMTEALRLAHIAGSLGEVPVGAVVVVNNDIVGRGYNRRELDNSPVAHAEIMAIEEACKHLGRWRLTDAVVYSTLEPCLMCAGALLHARIAHLVYGACDTKFGAIHSLYSVADDVRLNHRFSVTSGVLVHESATLLKAFFASLRNC